MNSICRIKDERAVIVRKRRDLFPIAIIAIPILSGLVHSAFLGAMTASVKEKIVDPLVDKCIEGCKSLVKDKGKNETYRQTILRNLKKNLKKLASVLKKEKAPIANKVQSLADKVEKEEEKAKQEAKKKKDSLVRVVDISGDGWSTLGKAIAYILGTIGGIIVYLVRSSKTDKNGKTVTKLQQLSEYIKSNKFNLDGFKSVFKRIKSLVKRKSVPEDKIHDLDVAIAKASATSDKIRKGINEKRVELTGEFSDLSKQLSRNASWLQEVKSSEVTGQWNKMVAEASAQKAAIKQSKSLDYKQQDAVLEDASSFAEKMRNAILESSKVIAKYKKAEILRKNVLAGKNKGNKYIQPKPSKEKTDSIDRYIHFLRGKKDSRLKRSTKRPGRATSWEIKAVLNYPESSSLPNNFIGEVDAQGNVTVYDKNKSGPASLIARMASTDLDIKAQEKLNVNTGFRGTPFAKINNPYSVVPISPAEKSKFKQVMNGIKTVVGVSVTVATLLKTLTNLGETAATGITVLSNFFKGVAASGKQAEAVANTVASQMK